MLDRYNEIQGVVLNDNTFINSNDDLRDHLASLGYDPDEVGTSLDSCINNDEWVRREDVDAWQAMYSDLDVNVRSFVSDLKELNEVFVNSRKYTKAKYVQIVNSMLAEYLNM